VFLRLVEHNYSLRSTTVLVQCVHRFNVYFYRVMSETDLTLDDCVSIFRLHIK